MKLILTLLCTNTILFALLYQSLQADKPRQPVAQAAETVEPTEPATGESTPSGVVSVRATSHRLAIAAPLKKTRVLQEGTRIPNTRLFTRIGPSRQWRQIRKQAYKLVETQVAIPLSLRFNYHRFTRSTQTHEKGRVYSVAPFLEGAHLRGGWYGTLYISQSGPEKRTWKVPFRLDADKKRLFVSVGKQEHRAMDWASKVFDPYARYLMGR